MISYQADWSAEMTGLSENQSYVMLYITANPVGISNMATPIKSDKITVLVGEILFYSDKYFKVKWFSTWKCILF